MVSFAIKPAPGTHQIPSAVPYPPLPSEHWEILEIFAFIPNQSNISDNIFQATPGMREGVGILSPVPGTSGSGETFPEVHQQQQV